MSYTTPQLPSSYEWFRRCRRTLLAQNLIGWVLPSTIPDSPDAALNMVDPSLVEHLEAYENVRDVMEEHLGEAREQVYRHPLFMREIVGNCPLLRVRRTIEAVLDDLNRPVTPSFDIGAPSSSSSSFFNLPADIPLATGNTSSQGQPQVPSSPLTSRSALPFEPLAPSSKLRTPPSAPRNQGMKKPRPASTTPTPSARTSTLVAGSSPDQANSSSFPVAYPADCGIASSVIKARGKLLLDQSLWGSRCVICGHVGIKRPQGHPSHECTQKNMSSLDSQPVYTTMIETPSRHLVVIRGPKTGDKLCYAWQYLRHQDGRCYVPGCQYLHHCSLCLNPDHKAVDCAERMYRPLIKEPRPSSLPPRLVRSAFDGYRSNLSTSTPSRISRPHALLSTGKTPSAVLMPPPASSSSSASALSAVKYAIDDRLFHPHPLGTAPRRCATPVRLNVADLAVQPARTLRIDTAMLMEATTPDAQSYHRSVPSQVQVRPGYRCRITPAEISQQLDACWAPRFEHAVASASRILPEADLPNKLSQRTRDQRLHQVIRDEEHKAGVVSAEWEVPSLGLTGSKRFQYSDGDNWAAGIVLLPHYPPAHADPHSFTYGKSGGFMLAAGGLASASLTGNHQLAFSNAIPIFFKVDTESASMSRPGPDGTRIHYPNAIRKACLNVQKEDILARIAQGSSQFIVGLGSSSRQLLDSVCDTASRDQAYAIESVTIRSRPTRAWEAGALCMETLVLRQAHTEGGRPVSARDRLFYEDAIEAKEAAMVLSDERGLGVEDDRCFVHRFDLISHRDWPDRCVVLHSAIHMSAATDVPAVANLHLAGALDVTLCLIEDLYFDRARTARYPFPTWRFLNAKVDSILNERGLHEEDNNSTNILSTDRIALIERFRNLLRQSGKSVVPSLLPQPLRTMFESVKLTPSPKGVVLDPNDPIDVIVKTNERRHLLLVEKSGKRSRSASATPSAKSDQSSASSQSASTSSAAAANGTYRSICECGLISQTPYHLGKPLLTEIKVTRSGRHRPTQGKPVDSICLTGIPASAGLLMVARYRSLSSKASGDQAMLPGPIRRRAELIRFAKFG